MADETVYGPSEAIEAAASQQWMAEPTGQVPDSPERREGQHEILAIGDKSNLHVAYVRTGALARAIVEEHNRLIERLPASDESAFTPRSRVARNRHRMTARWRNDLHIVETDDGSLHVATCSGTQVAEHIAILHNRTLGDGQEPPPGYIEDPRPINEALRAGPHPNTAAYLAKLAEVPDPYAGIETDLLSDPGVREWLRLNDERRPGHRPPGYHVPPSFWRERHGTWSTPEPASASVVAKVSALIEREIQVRVTHWLATEHRPVFAIKESPAVMVKVLRDLGYAVAEPAEVSDDPVALKVRPAPKVEMVATRDHGLRLLIDGIERAHVNSGDEGGAGLALAVRALAQAFNVQVIER